MNPDDTAKFSSPPCFAHELDDDVRGYSVVDATQAGDVARWRKAERARLIILRQAIPASARKLAAAQVMAHLDATLDIDADTIISVYWPFRGELNLRDWMRHSFHRGARVALPVVEEKETPMIFREWTPDATLVPGIWNIPVPVDGAVLEPSVVVSPLVGFDRARYRLGYGGGYFDRTLQDLFRRGVRPRVIGVGHSCTAIPTIYPQPHDIPMTDVITERGIYSGAAL